MTFFEQVGLAFKTYPEAIQFIFKNKLAHYFLYPLVISILLFVGGTALVNLFVDSLQKWVLDLFNLGGEGVLSGIVSGVVGILANILFYFVFTFILGSLIMIFMSPILGKLSERVEKILTGNEVESDWKQIFIDILRGLYLTLRNILLQLLWCIALFLLGFIPVLGWLAPLILFFVTCYYFGFGNMDFTCERRGLTGKDTIRLVRKYRGFAVTNGLIFALTLYVPFCRTFIPPFVALIGVAAATIAMQKFPEFKNQ